MIIVPALEDLGVKGAATAAFGERLRAALDPKLDPLLSNNTGVNEGESTFSLFLTLLTLVLGVLDSCSSTGNTYPSD